MVELQALPFYAIRKQDHQGTLGRFYSRDRGCVQDELFDGQNMLMLLLWNSFRVLGDG